MALQLMDLMNRVVLSLLTVHGSQLWHYDWYCLWPLGGSYGSDFFFSKGFVDIFENVEKFEEMDSVLFDHLVRLSKTRNR